MNSKAIFSQVLWISGLLILMFVSGCSKKKEDVQTKPGPTTPPEAYVKTDVMFWLTKADSTVRFTRQNVALNFSTTGTSNPSIVVDSLQTYQTVDGFGFALTGGSAYLINRLSVTDRNNILHELFASDSTFLGISYLRISIGSSDLNDHVFSYDDINPSSTDTLLTNFDITPDTYDLIPVLQSILAINPNIKILGSPWSAPAWMKTSKNSIGGSLIPEYYSVYASYFVKYLQTMKAKGITLDAVTVQNEPEYGGNNPSMMMTAAQQADFVKNYMGPAFKSANITTKIIVFDHNCDDPNYPITVLNDSDARQYIDGSAFHLYGGSISALTQVHNAYPDKNVYFTEEWVGGSAVNNFAADLKWHVENLIIGAPKNWSKIVLEWNLASDPSYKPHTQGGCSTCLGALTIGTDIRRNVSYFIVAHASKFVKSGSVRIGSSGVGNLSNVAYKTPEGRKVLIVLNQSSSTQHFNIKFGDKYVTTSLDGGSVATYVW
jgi:glucosylceramidase